MTERNTDALHRVGSRVGWRKPFPTFSQNSAAHFWQKSHFSSFLQDSIVYQLCVEIKWVTSHQTDVFEFITIKLVNSERHSAHKCKTGPTGDHWSWQTSHLQIHPEVPDGGEEGRGRAVNEQTWSTNYSERCLGKEGRKREKKSVKLRMVSQL